MAKKKVAGEFKDAPFVLSREALEKAQKGSYDATAPNLRLKPVRRCDTASW